MIRFERVTKGFGSKIVLNNVSFTVNAGEILFILGRSGTGKSVTLKTLVGLLKADAGSVMVHTIKGPISVAEASPEDLALVRKTCGMVFQHPALLDSLTVEENIAFGLKEWEPTARHERVKECLRLVHLGEDILDFKPQQISYGMQKRVSIARTLAPQPRALLFDEPTTGLDPITTNAINELIKDLSRSLGVASIVVSHDMGCALNAADRIIVLDNGQILIEGSVSQIKNSTIPLIKDFLSEALEA